MALSPLCWFSVTPSTTHNQIGPLWCCFPGGWVCARSRPLWVSPTTSPVRPDVSPTAASTPTCVFNQRFEALFLCAGTLGGTVCHPVHQLLPPCQLQLCPPRSTICHLAGSTSLRPPCLQSSPPGCLSLPLLPVWIQVSSLSPWLSDFHTVQFSVSSGCFLFLNCCSFGCARRHNVSTYASILASGSLCFSF